MSQRSRVHTCAWVVMQEAQEVHVWRKEALNGCSASVQTGQAITDKTQKNASLLGGAPFPGRLPVNWWSLVRALHQEGRV
jgi:hypothetical protein